MERYKESFKLQEVTEDLEDMSDSQLAKILDKEKSGKKRKNIISIFFDRAAEKGGRNLKTIRDVLVFLNLDDKENF